MTVRKPKAPAARPARARQEGRETVYLGRTLQESIRVAAKDERRSVSLWIRLQLEHAMDEWYRSRRQEPPIWKD